MLKRFIHQLTRLLAKPSAPQSEQPKRNVPTNAPRGSMRNGNRADRFPSLPRQNSHDGCPRRNSDGSHHHNAERLLREGHLRIAVTGFNDTAFDISVMRRHDSSQLASAVSDLPCKVKIVAERNIADGLAAGIKALDDGQPGRRGIVLITSGDAQSGHEHIQRLAARAADLKIGIHVICLGVKTGDSTGGPRISTKANLGYGLFRAVETGEQLLASIRDAFQGLTPAFGMRGTNKAVVLLDCSETMVEAYRDTTRIDMVISSLGRFLETPLVRTDVAARDEQKMSSPRPPFRRKPVSWQTHAALGAAGGYEWSPRST